MKRAVAALSLGILVLVSSGPLAYAGTLTDLNAQLASLNINASEIAVPCNTATNQSSADVAAVNTLRQTLVTDEANPIADSISKDLQALAAAVTQQESDESLMLSACTPVKLNQIDINEAQKKLSLISQVQIDPNAQEAAFAAAASGTLIYVAGCDNDIAASASGYIEYLNSDGKWISLPTVVHSFLNPTVCNYNANKYGRWTIENLSPGIHFRWYFPYWGIASEVQVMPDYFSQYTQQKQQIIADAQDAKASYTSVWDSALAKDIQSSVSVVAPLVAALDSQIKVQASKYPQNAVAYQKIVTAEPVAPAFSSDNSADLAASTTYLATVSAFQTSVPAQLQKLIPKPLTIQCVKGTKSKKVTGIAPKCPTGFKLRK